MRQWPDYAGGVGNNAPAQPNAAFKQRPMGMAERQTPGANSTTY
jgi:hypothetical protein